MAKRKSGRVGKPKPSRDTREVRSYFRPVKSSSLSAALSRCERNQCSGAIDRSPTKFMDNIDNDKLDPTLDSSARTAFHGRELYKSSMTELDSAFSKLLEKHGEDGFKADEIAETMELFLAPAERLIELSPMLAFDFVMDLGEHTYGDLGFEELFHDHRVRPDKKKRDMWVDRSGHKTRILIKKMDRLMVRILETRLGVDTPVPGPFDIVISEHGVGSQYLKELGRSCKHIGGRRYLELHKMRQNELLRLVQTRRERRAATADWAGNALNDLIETGSRIACFNQLVGKLYFSGTIRKLCEVKEVDILVTYQLYYGDARLPEEIPIIEFECCLWTWKKFCACECGIFHSRAPKRGQNPRVPTKITECPLSCDDDGDGDGDGEGDAETQTPVRREPTLLDLWKVADSRLPNVQR